MMSLEKKNVRELCDSCDLPVTKFRRHPNASFRIHRCEIFFVAKIIHPFWEVARHPSSALPIHLFPLSNVRAHCEQ